MLRITMTLDSVWEMDADARVERLSAAILDEIERVRGRMTYGTYDPYQEYSRFAGMKFLDGDYQQVCRIGFASLQGADAQDGAEMPFLLTAVNGNQMSGVYSSANGSWAQVKITFDTYASPVSKWKQGSDEVKETTLENGSQWLLYVSKTAEDGSICEWHASKAVDGMLRNKSQMYLEITVSSDSITWADMDECIWNVARWDAGISVVSLEEDPCVPGPADETQAPEA